MSDPAAEFFDRLGRRGHEPLLEEATGTTRFDLEHAHGVDHWLVTIMNGDLQVSREKSDADCVIRTDKALFGRFVSGEAHLYTAWVRNELRAEGDVRLARLFERVFPGPPGAHHPRGFARERGRQA
ncbi:SCP2 sterol-binding domain-containing protein [Micromonospora sp. IBHARD004]|uniref:SCP2 sterol-binding domain-containing protein n=1 Tax=Micromonospora sp. IBHARD004 TaxID=3457764 RepID=UPI004058E0FE